MPPRDPWNSIDWILADLNGTAAWQPPSLPLFRAAPAAADGTPPNGPSARATAQPAAPSNSSLLDLVGALAWAPPNLPLFGRAPTAAGGSPPAPSSVSSAAQAAAASEPRELATLPAIPVSHKFDFIYDPPPIAPPVPFMDSNPFFERPQDQPLYPYTQPVPAGADRRHNPANPPALPSAPAAPTQPAASVPLPRPRPPEAWLTPMYPAPKAPAKPKEYFDPTTVPPPLMPPSDGWRRPSLEDRWLSPSWSSNMPTAPSPPLLDRSRILERSGINVPDLVDAIISAESPGGDTYTRSNSSSALGAGQFTNDTWVGDLKHNQAAIVRADPWLDASVRDNPNSLTLDQAKDGGLMDMRTNYEMSWRATARLAEENAASLARAHLPLTPGNLYLAHFLGSPEAKAVLRADPRTPAEQVLSRATMLANRSLIEGRTVGQVISEINARVARPRHLPFR
jgi:hypothetical protein